MKRLFIIFTLLPVLLLTACSDFGLTLDSFNPVADTAVAPSIIDIAAIPGVTPPESGAVPVTTITETAQYTGTVAWSGSPATFAETHTYTATISLTAKAGYTLSGVAADFFTVAGAASDTNPVNSGVVTAVFPATALLTMINVPAGRFQRDATATNISVITQTYRMSAYEITRAQFAAMLMTDPSNTTYSSGTTDPVQMTNWYHAIAFCNKLSIAEGLTPVYAVTGVNFSTLTYAAIPLTDNATWNAVTATWTNNGYRLPTEMEWMWAAMGAPVDGQGGGTNTTGYTKAFAGSTGSNAIGDYAWYHENVTDSKSQPVGGKLANELGLYDMSGNVWEWNWDRYATYPTGTQTDYRGAASGTGRVLRGGCWDNVATYCTVAYRSQFHPYFQDNFYGFRVVRP
jgi:formylglycine-generating enzyme